MGGSVVEKLGVALTCVGLLMGPVLPRSGAQDPVVQFWNNPDGGEFTEPGNWDNDVPWTDEWGAFNLDQDPAYTVELDASWQMESLQAQDDRVILDLSGENLWLTLESTITALQVNTGMTALAVARGEEDGTGHAGTLILRNTGIAATLTANSFVIGGTAASTGHLVVEGANTELVTDVGDSWGDAHVGHMGAGRVTIRDNATWSFLRIYMTRGAASNAEIFVEDGATLQGLGATRSLTMAVRGESLLHVRHGGVLRDVALQMSERSNAGTFIVENATAEVSHIYMGRYRATDVIRVIDGGSLEASTLRMGTADRSGFDADLAGGRVEVSGGSSLKSTSYISVGGNATTDANTISELSVSGGSTVETNTYLALHSRGTLAIDGGTVSVGTNLTAADGAESEPMLRLTLYAASVNAPLHVVGNAALGKLGLDLDLAEGFDADVADVFEILRFGGTRTGTFLDLADGATIAHESGYEFEIDYGATSDDVITLSVTVIPEPGTLALLLGAAGLLVLRRRRQTEPNTE